MNKSSIVEITLARFMAFCDGVVFDEEISETVSRTDPAIMRQVATSASDEAIARIARSSLMDRTDVRPAIEYELQVRNLLKNGSTPGHQVLWTLGQVAAPEYRAEQERKNKEAMGQLDAIARKRAEEAVRRGREMRAMQELDEAYQSKDDVAILKAANNLAAVTRGTDAQRDIEAATEMHDVPLGPKAAIRDERDACALACEGSVIVHEQMGNQAAANAAMACAKIIRKRDSDPSGVVIKTIPKDEPFYAFVPGEGRP